ncbi:MAG: DUF4962 domain-containing protein [Armatimonadota bacterium]|nr:DUF4962 domain-containing protein [Armatimonadota bacterium]
MIGAESVVPVNPRSLWCRYVNWRPADGEVVSVNPPRISWPYNADFPEDFGDALHMFTLQIAADPEFEDPAVNVTCPFNFYNTLPALDAGQTWHWRVGYDVGTAAEGWSDTRSFTIARDAAEWDRSALAEPDLAAMGHPRVLLRPEMMDRLRALAEEDPGSQAALQYIRRSADGILERPWWSDFPETDRGEEPEQAFYTIARDLAMVAFAWKITGDDRYAGVVERAVTWASYPPGGRASPEGLGGDGNEDATQGNEFLALLFDWLYEDMTEAQRQVMIASLEWRIDHIMNSFAWRGRRTSGPMLRMTFRAGREAALHEAEELELTGAARVLDDPDASGGRIVELAGEDAAIALTAELDPGPYVVTVAAHGPAPDQDAFLVALDDGEPQRTFVQDRGETSVRITVTEAGEHTIRVTPGEVGVRIDSMCIDVHGDQRLRLQRTAEWKEFTWRAEAPVGSTRVTVEPFNYYAAGEVWWDEIVVSREPGGPNLLQNGEFAATEDGTRPAAWSFHSFGTDGEGRYEATGGTGDSGAVGVICPDSGDRGSWSQVLELAEPGTYHVRGRYRTSVDMLTAPVRGTSLSGQISSHQFEASMDTAVCGLVLYEHSAIGREWFELMLNYLIGVTCGCGFDEQWNEGAGYGSSKNKWLTNASLYFDTALPEANLGRNPFYPRLGSWLRRIIPVGMDHHAWGNQRNASRGNHLATFRKLAYLTTDGRFLYNWHSYGGELFSGFRPWIEYCLPAYYEEPEPVPESEVVEVFDIGGWAMAATGPPSDPATYAEGAGVILQCRPRGGYSHSFNSDGSVQLHAYGQMLNHGGGTSANQDAYAYHTMSHNVVLIDGLGQGQPPAGMRHPTYGHICGHARGDDFVYFAADPTLCYPHEPGSFSRWSLPLREPYTERALPYLDSYIRHVLFMRGRYFVIFDDLRCSQPATYTWLWHILPDNPLSFNPETFAIDYTVGDVPVRLQHAFRPDALELDDREGMQGRVNPITGEDWRQFLRGDIVEGHNLWISTAEPAAQWAFLAVVYPQPPGGEIPPIVRADDRTVRVGEDVICFDPDSEAAAEADIVVDVTAFRHQ